MDLNNEDAHLQELKSSEAQSCGQVTEASRTATSCRRKVVRVTEMEMNFSRMSYVHGSMNQGFTDSQETN